MQAAAQISESAELIKEANLDLSLKLLKNFASDGSDNFIVSPFSVYMITDMMANGAENETLTEMTENILAPKQDITLQTFNESMTDYLKAKRYDGKTQSQEIQNNSITDDTDFLREFQIEINNAIWAEDLSPKYKEDIKKYLNADTFALPNNTSVINKWIEKKTHKKISKLLDERDITSNDAYIVNTTYFKDNWETPFEESGTIKTDFYSLNKEQSTPVNMMHQAIITSYFEDENMQALRLSYASGKSLQIFLPRENVDFNTFLQNLQLEDLDSKYYQATVSLYLPRFKIYNLVENMPEFFKNTGVKRIFESSAQLGPMSGKPVRISQILHAASITIDENGTEAAAATAVDLEVGLGRHDMNEIPFVTFNANHPFIFMIDNGLFVGVYTQGSLQ